MADFPNKVSLPVEQSEHSSWPFQSSHITTGDFMMLQPSFYRFNIPNEKFEVDMRTFCRLKALPQPTLGNVSIHSRAFFVPFRVVNPSWTEFITDTVALTDTQARIPDAAPYFLMSGLQRTFSSMLGSVAFSQAATKADPSKTWTDPENLHTYDFVVATNPVPADSDYRKLTFRGRCAMKLLNCLGYKVDFSAASAGTNVPISALGLMCFVKVYLDYYWPPQYYNSPIRIKLEQLLNLPPNSFLSEYDLSDILENVCFVNYDSDYFTSAFDEPTGPSMGDFTQIQLPDISGVPTLYQTASGSPVSLNLSSKVSINPSTGTPFASSSVSGNGIVTSDPNPNLFPSSYLSLSLEALTKYAKRHQLAGCRALDRYLAQFGVVLSAEKLKRSNYLGSMITPIDFGDVMSNSDTQTQGGAYLGAYAGKGFGYGQNGHFEYSSNEYGLFVILSSIVPKTGYVQGIDRHHFHIGKTDFFTSAFDGLGNQAISRAELYVPINGSSANFNTTTLFDGIFGFAPRYSEYKMQRDFLTGDFAFNSLNAAGETSSGWHLYRLFDDSSFNRNSANMVHNLGFVMETSGNSQFDRIFYNTDSSEDHFILIHSFNGRVSAPCRPLYDELLFEDDEHQKRVSVEVNGVRAN